MYTVTGQSISSEPAIGTIRFYRHIKNIIKDAVAADTQAELARYRHAYRMCMEQLEHLYRTTSRQLSSTEADIFEMHRMLLADNRFGPAVENAIIQQSKTAEYAVYSVGQNLWEQFVGMEDPYLRARAADIQDVMNRLLFALSGKKESALDHITEPFILMAEDLSPSETVQLHSDRLLGFVTRQGSPFSHTAILARTMGIPALINIDINEDWDGHLAIIDSEKQCLIIDPDETLIRDYQAKVYSEQKKREALLAIRDYPAVTRDGREVKLYANINTPLEISAAADCGAEGIGLFRSEFLYLNVHEYPDEEMQYQIYRDVIAAAPRGHIVIRTLDLGADKKSPYLALEPEDNPALGYRAIRICLRQPDRFKVQLRALLRAAAHGTLHVMFPMIISVTEVLRAKELLAECRQELADKKIPYGEPIVGIMIETPAAALDADRLAEEVDFFSIGTNDLAQYTLALDRNNAQLHTFYDPHHPALIRLIGMTVEAAHRHHIPVCICGESGADLTLTKTFVSMGIDALSVAPNALLPLKKTIRSL